MTPVAHAACSVGSVAVRGEPVEPWTAPFDWAQGERSLLFPVAYAVCSVGVHLRSNVIAEPS